jgi:hypothetical protein
MVRGRDRERVLKLDCPARGHHCRGEQRRDVPGPGAERPDRYDGGRGSRRAARGQGAPGRATPGSADPEHVRQHAQRPERGHDRGEALADAAQLVSERFAAGAVAHVPPGGGVRPQAAVVGEDQLLADVRASGVPRLERLGEG